VRYVSSGTRWWLLTLLACCFIERGPATTIVATRQPTSSSDSNDGDGGGGTHLFVRSAYQLATPCPAETRNNASSFATVAM